MTCQESDALLAKGRAANDIEALTRAERTALLGHLKHCQPCGDAARARGLAAAQRASLPTLLHTYVRMVELARADAADKEANRDVH